MKIENSIVPGSISAIAAQTGKSIAETFTSADTIVIVDTSGSMAATDSRGRRSRYDVACEELAALQQSLPGKIAVFSFSDFAEFCPGGTPRFIGGGTDLAGALRFTKIADNPGRRFIVISDGQPDEPDQALKVAATYQNRIDTIYVGPEAENSGRRFLEMLATRHAGQAVTAKNADGLLKAAQLLLHA